MSVRQKRISSAIVDAADDAADDVPDESLDVKSKTKFNETKLQTTERKVTVVGQSTDSTNVPEDELYESSGSTNSDLYDVLNCLREPRDIKHKCHISCPLLKKEECKWCKAAPPSDDDYNQDNYAYAYRYSQSFEDFDLLGAKPVRIPIVHAKGCVHERESQIDTKVQELSEPCKWCYCEDEGTSDEEAHYNYQVYEKFRDPNDVGFVKYSPPKLMPVDETGAVDWKNVPQDSDLQDVLNCMLPPKVFTIDGQIWVQEVSPKPARRTDVIKLVEVLEMKIEEQQMKSTGIDPVRSSLYEQLFDELIREEAVVSPETGLLLLRMRDEMKMTIAAWESILNQSNNYGMQNISKYGEQMKPLQNELFKLTGALETAEKELTEFWAEQHLIKSEEIKKRSYVLDDRKTELGPHQARYKLLKEQIRLLMNREEDNTTHQSHLS